MIKGRISKAVSYQAFCDIEPEKGTSEGCEESVEVAYRGEGVISIHHGLSIAGHDKVMAFILHRATYLKLD